MGFDFTPRNKKAGDYSIGAFSWPDMLDAGLGLVLGIGEGFEPGQFVYIERPDGRCVRHNDGAKVTAKESKELAKVARWIVRVQQARIYYYSEKPVRERGNGKVTKLFHKTMDTSTGGQIFEICRLGRKIWWVHNYLNGVPPSTKRSSLFSPLKSLGHLRLLKSSVNASP